eukprot:Sspe_Gene.54406::Locus_30036_Transcript_1_1_Confidence_1.000_Length_2022::g.54406::m.54406/K05970/SIAE; sialate O-acetylesterase
MLRLSLLLVILSPLPAAGALWMNGLFQDHMVLQRNGPNIPPPHIYGMADLGETVVVKGSEGFPGPFTLVPETTNKSSPMGNWSVAIPAPASDGPFNVTITSSKGGKVVDQVDLHDVVFGDVFVCSGQSNMVLSVGATDNKVEEEELANSLPNIRIFDTAHREADAPTLDIGSGGGGHDWGPKNWTVASNTTITRFSAVCWTAGRMLAQWLEEKGKKSPYIGLIQSTIGGTTVHWWGPGVVGVQCNQTGQLPSKGEAAQHVPGWLWNNMVNPIANGGSGLSVRAAAYYQGEADSGENDRFPLEGYACELKGLMAGWREEWKQTIPFAIVQLPGSGSTPTGDIGWQAIQAAQAQAVAESKNAVLVTSPDQGYGGLHFPHKIEIGRRVSLAWRALAYGDSVTAVGPRAVSAAVDKGAVRVTIDSDGLKQQESYMCNASHLIVESAQGSWNVSCCNKGLVDVALVAMTGELQTSKGTANWTDAPPLSSVATITANTITVTPLMPAPGQKIGSLGNFVKDISGKIASVDITGGFGCVLANSDGLVMGRQGRIPVS